MNTCRKLGCLILTLALSFPCFAKRSIEWGGRWNDRIKSIFPGLPIQAWVEDNNKDLLVEFSADLGTVEVTVMNRAGEVVYSQYVKAEAMSSTIISLEEEVTDGVLAITDGENLVHGNFNF